MMEPTHRIWGAHQGMVTGALVGHLWSPYVALSAAVLWSGLGYAFACIPDRVERPLRLGHRKLSHWPEPPLIVALLGLSLASSPLGYVPMMIGFSLSGICCSLLSHWTGDFMFGKAWIVNGAVIRHRGVPMLFGTQYEGFGWKVDGKGEKYFRRFLKSTLPIVFLLILYFTLGGS